MKEIRVGVVGLGNRGKDNTKCILLQENVTVTAVCDVYEDRREAGVKIVTDAGQPVPFSTDCYEELVTRSDVDVVVIFTSWEFHIPVAIAAMKAGKAVAMEVGAATTLQECFDLVQTWEETRVPFMFLENCCYDKHEMMVRRMVRDGLFGEVVYCHGAYGHDIREEVAGGNTNRHYRLNHYTYRNLDNYPTHELGPIAKILKINRGNRMVRLVSMASKAAGMTQYINDRKDTLQDKSLIGRNFAQGDVVDTLITCANGETISIRLDTTLPRSYDREFTVRGTKGLYNMTKNEVHLDGEPEVWNPTDGVDSATRFYDQYLHDYWKNISPEQMNSGHGGMDYFEFRSFFENLRAGNPMPIDVYDAAAWIAVSVLSEQSIAGGNVPVEIPDFTNGAWKTREDLDF